MNNPKNELERVIKELKIPFKKASRCKHIKWEQEIFFVEQALSNNQTLYRAALNNIKSFQTAILNLVAIGVSLSPAKKHAYLVPRASKRGEKQIVFLDISYQGLIHLATQSGLIEWVQSQLVYENDRYINQGIISEIPAGRNIIRS